MRVLGILFLVLGVAGLLYGLQLDTSVATSSGIRAYNIGLLLDRQSIIISSGVLALAGALLYGFSSLSRNTSTALYRSRVELGISANKVTRITYIALLALALLAPMLGLYPVFVMKLLCFALFA